jgi:hypothetical protein
MASMPPFRNLMYAYLHACLDQVMVAVACNGAHSLKQRLARWLLMVRDRSDGGRTSRYSRFARQHARCAKPTITNAARELERSGLIERG